MSCFDLIFDHPVVERTNKIRTYYWMKDRSLSRDELERDWIIFTWPTPLAIPSHIVQHCFKMNGSFTVSIVDAIMVLWNYLDTKVYYHFQGHEQIDGYDYLNSDAIKSSFIGEHITYNIADCQKIIILVFASTSWSCYFWDFKTKKNHRFGPHAHEFASFQISRQASMF